MSLNKINLPGYPRPLGESPAIQWKGDYFGNSNYQQGGDKAFASDYGYSGIEEFAPQFGGYSQTGNYFMRALMPANASNVNETLAPCFNNCTVKWYYAANSVEVANNTNLAAEVCRVTVTLV